MPIEKWLSDLIYLGSEAIACVAYLYVGVRLHLLSRRTGRSPELLMSLTFVFWTLSYVMYDVPYAIVLVEELVPEVCAFGSLVAVGIGNFTFACFIRTVFHPRDRWAAWLVGAIGASLVAGVAGSAYLGDWEGVDPFSNPWYWFENFGGFAPYFWIGAEGLVHYFTARRRLRLGFCDAMTCHRFLLWGVAGSLWLFVELIRTSNEFVLALTGGWSELLNTGTAIFEVVPVGVIWLAFFPPPAYARWIDRAALTTADRSDRRV